MSDEVSATKPVADEWEAGLGKRATEWAERRATLVAQRRELLDQVAPLTAEIADIDNKTAAAMLIAPSVADVFFKADAVDDAVQLPDAILEALKIPPIPTPGITREQIKQRLPMVKYDVSRLQANPNFLHIALKQMVERKQLVEKGSRFRLVEPDAK